MEAGHKAVLVKEVLEGLNVKPGGQWLDATLGLGGHSEQILEKSSPAGSLLGIDQDEEAIAIASKRLSRFDGRFRIIKSNFSKIAPFVFDFDKNKQGFDGFLADLGVSSLQLDQAERGFSFQKDGPLDMRMDASSGQSAANWLNQASEEEIRQVLFELGEESRARQIARAICKQRPFEGTLKLAEVVSAAVGGRQGSKIHPATKTFQALRLKINGELEALKALLPQALGLLKKGGRLAIISFHSLEDRMVKEFFKLESTGCLCPPDFPVCRCGHQPSLRLVNKKPITASEAELADNPRSRSAKLRVAEKL